MIQNLQWGHEEIEKPITPKYQAFLITKQKHLEDNKNVHQLFQLKYISLHTVHRYTTTVNIISVTWGEALDCKCPIMKGR